MYHLRNACSQFRCSFLVGAILLTTTIVNAQDKKITFDQHVKPIFQQRCAACHNGSRQSGGLDVTNYTNLMQGGGSGQSIEPGDASSSYLYLLVTHEESPKMPPDGTKIPDSNLSTIAAWIDGGALENSGSIARSKPRIATSTTINVGVRPEQVAYPARMSLRPHHHAKSRGAITALATSPWAPITAVGATKQILLFDNRDAKFLGALPFQTGRANVLTFSRNGDLLLAAGGRHGLSGKVFVWDTNSTELAIELGEEVDTILAADISADHRLIAAGGPQKILRVYSSQSRELTYEIKKHTEWITALSFSPDGVLLASGDRNGGLHIWEADTGNEYLTLGGHGRAITDFSWRGDANVLASTSDDGTIKLWEMEQGRQIKSWSAHKNGSNSVHFNRKGELVSVGRDTEVKLWKQDGKLIRQFKGLGEFGIRARYCDESDRLIATDFAGFVHQFDSASGKRIGELPTSPERLESQLNKSRSQHAKLSSELVNLETKSTDNSRQLQLLQQQLAVKTANRDSTSEQIKKLQSDQSDTSQKLQSVSTARVNWQAQLENANKSLPAVIHASASALAAAEQIPADKELREIAERLKEKEASIKSQIEKLDEQITQSIAEYDSLDSNLFDIQSQIESQSAGLAQSNESIQKLNEKIVPHANQKTELEQKLDRLRKQVSAAETEVKFWENEIEFDVQLVKQKAALQACREQISNRQSELDAAKQALADAQSAYDAKRTKLTQTKQQLENQKARLEKLRSRN